MPPRQQVLRGKELVRRIKELGDARKLEKVLALVEASPIPETRKGRRITIGAVIGACCKCGNLELGLKLLRQLDGPDDVGAGAPAYCALIQAHGRAGRLNEALLLLETWEKGRGPKGSKIGVGRNGTIYVASAGKWRKKDVPLKSSKWRDDMGTVWHAPRVAQSRMLLTVLDACASCGDIGRARFFKDRILNWEGRVEDGRLAFDGVSDAEAAWNGVAKAHAMSTDPLSCLAVLREMEGSGTAPSQCTYNIALSSCQRGGRPDWARTLVQRMRKIGARSGDVNMYPDAVSYTTAARAEAAAARGYTGAEHAGGLEAVEVMWAEVRGPLGPPPDPQCYGALIDAFVAYGALGHALAAINTAEAEPGVELTARVYLGVMRAQAAAGDVRGVEVLARHLEGEMAARAASRAARVALREQARRDGKPPRRRKGGQGTIDVDGNASTVAAAAAIGGAVIGAGAARLLPGNLGKSGGAAVEAEVVMCEAEAKAAAGDAAGARAALERLKLLDFASSSKVLRDRSTELLVSLFVKDVIGRSDTRQVPSNAAEPEVQADDAAENFVNLNLANLKQGQRQGEQSEMWGITQALDLIDSAWGFASLDEDDEFLPSLDEDDIPVPAAGGFGGFLNTAVKGGTGANRGTHAPSYPGSDSTWNSFSAAPTLRSSEAADALELWAGAANRLFAGEAEPLIFRGGIDPGLLLREVPDVGMTLDDDEDFDFEHIDDLAEYDTDGDCDRVGGGWCASPLDGRDEVRFVVREDEPAAAAAEAVGRDFVAVVIDREFRPVGILRGSSGAAALNLAVPERGTTSRATVTTVRDVMGPPPTRVEADTATVGDVAVMCAAAAQNEPVAIVDGAGRLRRVLRREDLLEPVRSVVHGGPSRFTDPR